MNVPGFANPVHVYESFEDHHWWYLARRRIVAALLESLVPADAEVVDVGCGGGANIAELSARYRCVGIDISQHLVDAARRRFPTVEFIRGDAPQDLGAHAKGADIFLLMDVIEHIEDDKGYFRSLFEAARPGAAFLLTVPADPALWSPHDEAVGHQRRYTPEALAALWEGLPAEQLLLAYFNWFLLPLIALARAVNRRRGRVASSSGTDFDMPPALLNRLLAWIMTSERGRLVRLLANPRARGFRRGVSLVGVIRKAV